MPGNPAMTASLRALTVAVTVGTGAMGGVFFAFSTFVMRGLGRLSAAQGMAAMQQINVTAVSPAFMVGLFGTAVGCAGLAVQGVRTWGERPAALLVGGAALYLVGTIGLTIAYHVPRNDALAALDPAAAGSADAWAAYLADWTRANHVRTVSALAAAGAFALALRRP